jgi:hypothetical protein
VGLFSIDSDVPQFHGIESDAADEGDVMLDHENFERSEILSDCIELDILVEVFGNDKDLILKLQKKVIFLIDDLDFFEGLFVIEAIISGLILFGIAGIR